MCYVSSCAQYVRTCLSFMLSSRLPIDPQGIRLLPSVLSKRASFTISLFQMINYSTAYLHCDLSVCLRNNSECERVSLCLFALPSSTRPWRSFITHDQVSLLLAHFLQIITLLLSKATFSMLCIRMAFFSSLLLHQMSN